MEVEYSKARLLPLRRVYPDAFYAGAEDKDGFDFTSGVERMDLGNKYVHLSTKTSSMYPHWSLVIGRVKVL